MRKSLIREPEDREWGEVDRKDMLSIRDAIRELVLLLAFGGEVTEHSDTHLVVDGGIGMTKERARFTGTFDEMGPLILFHHTYDDYRTAAEAVPGFVVSLCRLERIFLKNPDVTVGELDELIYGKK